MGRSGRTHAALGFALFLLSDIVVAQTCSVPREISHEELLDVMRNAHQQGNYNIVAVPNWGRFQTDVFLRLIEAGLAHDSQGGVILISADNWYTAYLDVAGLTPETAAEGTRMAHRLGQMTVIDFRRGGVVRRVTRGPSPDLAANVRISWPGGPGIPTKFSYQDTVSEPHAKVTSRQVITYHLLHFRDDFGEMVWYDQIEGVSGRATSGFLAFLLRIFGERALAESRMATAADGILVTRLHLRKSLGKKLTVIVLPEGRGQHGILPGRPDLTALEHRLVQPLEMEYLPYQC